MRTYTQKEIYEYLADNPLNIEVRMGAVEDMLGQDYIILEYLNDIPTLHDNTAIYQKQMQITCLTRDYEDRKTLINYVQAKFLTSANYTMSDQSDYYIAQFTIGVFIYE